MAESFVKIFIFKLEDSQIQIIFQIFDLRKVVNIRLSKNKFNKMNYVSYRACFAEFKSYLNVKIGLHKAKLS